MRNLKRVLSMALALVMVLGMMVIGSSAATFTDADEITYTEAVEVMSGVGLFTGYDDGSLKPAVVLTREQAATLIARIKLGSVAIPDPTKQIFTDVTTDRWSAGAIEYCYNIGMIDGLGDGTFNPTGELTGVAFAKLLLCAMGYDAEAEGYVGAKWSENLTADALATGLILDGVNIAGPLTREQAAQMILQALPASMVEYTTAYDYATGAQVKIGPNVVTTTTGKGIFAQTEPVLFMDAYFADLALVEGTVAMGAKKAVVMTDGTTEVALANDFAFEIGRAGYVWAFGGKLISSVYFVDELLATVYDGDYAGWTTAATDLKDAAPNFVAEAKDAVVYINGVKSSAANLEKGAEVRLFDTPNAYGKYDGKIDLVIALQEDVDVVGATGVKTTTGKDGKEYVAVNGVVSKTETKYVVGYEDVAAKDVVLTVTMPTGITYLTVADSVVGQMTKRNIKTNTIIFEGVEYGESELTNHNVDELFHSGNQNMKTNYTMWLDRGGYGIWDSKIVDPDLYAVVLDTDYIYASAKNVTYYAELLFTDGTTETVETAANYAASEGEWVTYTTNVKGQIVLNNVNTAITADVTIDGKTAALGANRATEDTIYLVQSGTPNNYTYDAYIGFEEVPAMTAHGLNIVETDETNGLGNVLASHVFVASSDIYTKKDVVVYTLEDEDIWSWKDAKGNDYYEVPVLVAGEDDTLIFVNEEPADKLIIGYYADVVINSATGVVASLPEAEYTSAIASIDYADKTVEIDGKVWNAGEAMIFEIADADYEQIDLDDVDVDDTVVYVFTGKYIVEMYILPENLAPEAVLYDTAAPSIYYNGTKLTFLSTSDKPTEFYAAVTYANWVNGDAALSVVPAAGNQIAVSGMTTFTTEALPVVATPAAGIQQTVVVLSQGDIADAKTVAYTFTITYMAGSSVAKLESVKTAVATVNEDTKLIDIVPDEAKLSIREFIACFKATPDNAVWTFTNAQGVVLPANYSQSMLDVIGITAVVTAEDGTEVIYMNEAAANAVEAAALIQARKDAKAALAQYIVDAAKAADEKGVIADYTKVAADKTTELSNEEYKTMAAYVAAAEHYIDNSLTTSAAVKAHTKALKGEVEIIVGEYVAILTNDVADKEAAENAVITVEIVDIFVKDDAQVIYVDPSLNDAEAVAAIKAALLAEGYVDCDVFLANGIVWGETETGFIKRFAIFSFVDGDEETGYAKFVSDGKDAKKNGVAAQFYFTCDAIEANEMTYVLYSGEKALAEAKFILGPDDKNESGAGIPDDFDGSQSVTFYVNDHESGCWTGNNFDAVDSLAPTRVVLYVNGVAYAEKAITEDADTWATILTATTKCPCDECAE